jgi:hypothetical protein
MNNFNKVQDAAQKRGTTTMNSETLARQIVAAAQGDARLAYDFLDTLNRHVTTDAAGEEEMTNPLDEIRAIDLTEYQRAQKMKFDARTADQDAEKALEDISRKPAAALLTRAQKILDPHIHRVAPRIALLAGQPRRANHPPALHGRHTAQKSGVLQTMGRRQHQIFHHRERTWKTLTRCAKD